MLHLEPIHEARALIQYAEVDGDDPEVVAQHWIDATMSEVLVVVHLVKTLRPDLEGSEWYDDFKSAHKYMRRHGIAAAMKEIN